MCSILFARGSCWKYLRSRFISDVIDFTPQWHQHHQQMSSMLFCTLTQFTVFVSSRVWCNVFCIWAAGVFGILCLDALTLILILNMETVSCFCYFAILHMETVFARFCPVTAIPFISGFLFITTVAVHITEQLNSASCLAFKSHWICDHKMFNWVSIIFLLDFNWISHLGSDHNMFNWMHCLQFISALNNWASSSWHLLLLANYSGILFWPFIILAYYLPPDAACEPSNHFSCLLHFSLLLSTFCLARLFLLCTIYITICMLGSSHISPEDCEDCEILDKGTS